MKKIILIFIVILFQNLFAQENTKLSTALKYVLNNPLNKDNESTYPELFKTAFIKGFNKKTQQYQNGLMCIIRTTQPSLLLEKNIQIQSILPKFVVAFITQDQITEIINLPSVNYIDIPKIIYPTNEIGSAQAGAPLLHSGLLNNTPYLGDDVLTGIFDTGIDWDHPDFRNSNDQTKSRIWRLWDQTITPIAGENSPNGFSYGVEYTQAHINDELDGTPANYVREKDINGHGTHVAGTVAGNGAALSSRKNKGMAPNSLLVIVKGGNGSFSSTNEINAMTYFRNVADALGKPIVVNMSIGGQFGAHDGTNDDEIAVDNFCTSSAGKVVCISAGNDNGSNIHRQVTITPNNSGTYTINVPNASGSSSTDVFQISIYVNNTNTVNATLTMPNSTSVVANANQSISPTVNGNTAIAYLDNIIDAESGDRLINLYVVRNSITANVSGAWTLTLTNTSAQNVRLDGWLNYRGSNFSATNLTGGDNNYLVGSPGNATNAITVASYVGKLDWFSTGTNPNSGFAYSSSTQQDNISTFSSRGPRRDDVLKPNIAASGQAVISCLSTDANHTASDITTVGLYKKSQGTSMSSPVVAGCVALLLQIKPNATFTEIRNAIQNTAFKDAFTTNNLPNFIFGHGKLDVFKAASTLSTCTTFKRETLSYDSSTNSSNNPQVDITNRKAAVKFTSTLNGKIGGVYLKTGTKTPVGNLTLDVYSSDGNTPQTLLGTKNFSAAEVAKFTWNYFDVASLNISVNNNQDFFVVAYASSGDTLWIGNENLSINNRSFQFNGSSWTAISTDYRIRAVIFDNSIPTSSSTTEISACNEYTWNGTTYFNSGIYTKNGLTNAAGCDSSATLNLTIKPNYTVSILPSNNGSIIPNNSLIVCEGNSLSLNIVPNSGYSIQNILVNGIPIGAYSTYTFSNITANQTIQAIFTANCTTTQSSQNLTICNSQLPFVWNGLTFNSSSTQTATIINAGGCDSLATLNLTVNYATSSNSNLTIINTQLPYTWNGLIFNAAGSQTKTGLVNYLGCDSSATLNLSVNNLLISGNNNVCIGKTTQLSANFSGGTWSSLTPIRLSISNTGLITGLNAGTATIRYTLGNSFVNYIVTVNSLPAIPSIAFASGYSNPQSGCPAGTFGKNRTFGVIGIPSGGTWSAAGQASISNTGVVTTSNINGIASITYNFSNSNGCSSSRTMSALVGNCASRIANSTIDFDEVKVYPNPTNGIFNLSIPIFYSDTKINIINALGKVIMQQKIEAYNTSINLTRFSNGIYFIKLTNNKKEQNFKVIKQ